MTVEEIYNDITIKSVPKEVGIRLIENYGIRQQREAIEKMQKEYGGYSVEVESIINRINAQLDETFRRITGVEN